MAEEPKGNDWSEWKRYVLAAVKDTGTETKEGRKENHAEHKEIKKEISLMRRDIAVLQVKAGGWGALAGIVVVIGAMLLKAVT